MKVTAVPNMHDEAQALSTLNSRIGKGQRWRLQASQLSTLKSELDSLTSILGIADTSKLGLSAIPYVGPYIWAAVSVAGVGAYGYRWYKNRCREDVADSMETEENGLRKRIKDAQLHEQNSNDSYWFLVNTLCVTATIALTIFCPLVGLGVNALVSSLCDFTQKGVTYVGYGSDLERAEQLSFTIHQSLVEQIKKCGPLVGVAVGKINHSTSVKQLIGCSKLIRSKMMAEPARFNHSPDYADLVHLEGLQARANIVVETSQALQKGKGWIAMGGTCILLGSLIPVLSVPLHVIGIGMILYGAAMVLISRHHGAQKAAACGARYESMATPPQPKQQPEPILPPEINAKKPEGFLAKMYSWMKSSQTYESVSAPAEVACC